MYDLKHTDPERHRQVTGAPLAPIVRNLERLSARGVPIWLRVPLVPGINDDEANLRRVGELAARLPAVRQIGLLAYHPTAAGKYERLGRPYRLPDTLAPSDEQMEAAANLLRSYGLVVKVGG